MFTACVEVQSLIPFDVAAGVFATSDAKYLAGVGQEDAVNTAYNNYYRTRWNPYFLDRDGRCRNLELITSAHVVDWREYTHLEFAVDFMLANRMCKALTYMLPERQIILAIHRSRRSSGFTESDIDTLSAVNQHLNTLYSTLAAITAFPVPSLTRQVIAEPFALFLDVRPRYAPLWHIGSIQPRSPRISLSAAGPWRSISKAYLKSSTCVVGISYDGDLG